MAGRLRFSDFFACISEVFGLLRNRNKMEQRIHVSRSVPVPA
jgi:hypothetical protein